jgi:hypothetical protein
MDSSVTSAAAPHRDLSEYIKEEPLIALAMATAAGFVLGGGVNRRVGLAMLTIVGQIAIRSVASGMIAAMVTVGNDRKEMRHR